MRTRLILVANSRSKIAFQPHNMDMQTHTHTLYPSSIWIPSIFICMYPIFVLLIYAAFKFIDNRTIILVAFKWYRLVNWHFKTWEASFVFLWNTFPRSIRHNYKSIGLWVNTWLKPSSCNNMYICWVTQNAMHCP